ncbi:MAG: hypothetical protein AAGA35_02515 [Patescibacteria group bacterium]
MEGTPRAITWEAPEHQHIEKNSDWFWALGIVTIAMVLAALFFGNILFAFVLGLAGGVASLQAARKPRIIPFAVTVRGVRVDDQLYPYSSLEAYYIDEDSPTGPILLARSKRTFMPLIILPLPEEYIDDIDDIIKERLEEEHIEEPFFYKLLEFLGF